MTEPTGERYVPEYMSGQLIEAEHQARYRLAMRYVAGAVVVDAGCGVGWGSQLLLDAGATAVTGVDLDPEAVADAQKRTPGAEFVVGDLMSLPLDDNCADVVVCFEALEHTTDIAKTLDELVRILRPDGLLLVSSPNPAVYPAGNPFHFNELPPEVLLAEVAARFEETVLTRQHLMVSSIIHQELPPGAELSVAPVTFTAEAISVLPLNPGHDPYSVVIAGKQVPTQVPPLVVFAPSEQLDQLATLSAALMEERTALHQNQLELTAELDRVQQQNVKAHQDLAGQAGALQQAGDQLRAADGGLRSLTAERDALQDQLSQAGQAMVSLTAERDQLIQRVLAAESDALNRTHDLIQLQDLQNRTAQERDRLGADLIDAEQLAAHHQSIGIELGAELLRAHQLVLVDPVESLFAPHIIADVRKEVSDLTAEIDRIHATTSWRLTAPLRRVRRRLPRKLSAGFAAARRRGR